MGEGGKEMCDLVSLSEIACTNNEDIADSAYASQTLLRADPTRSFIASNPRPR